MSAWQPPKRLQSIYSCAWIEWDRSYKLIIAYHVYYEYYKIDRNKQSKITVHETDTLLLISRSISTAVEQITFHDTKIKHFMRTNIDHSRLTKIPFPTLYKVRDLELQVENIDVQS
jgi:hypothetical protein